MGKVFRAKFLNNLNKSGLLDHQLHRKLLKKPWVVYAKRPFLGPQQVTEYLGRYTHKIAISNHRITDISPKSVAFIAKNYKNAGKKEVAILSHHEFVRRFCKHPKIRTV
ncbi:transposase [Fulvivirga maritima]|uniref:transposase n=1 Tax=Fulvivirga maritima TaxID=2904247 RepID=UPI001F39E71E|nr:transposase [Fulvivirga maritima]UII25763.1 transposase [Fulvivirga maritima]